MGPRRGIGAYSNLIWTSIMLTRHTLSSAALAAALTVVAQAAGAAATDYALELVEATHPVGAGAILTVSLTDLRNGAPVEDAVIFATRMDMAPDGMAGMASRLSSLPSPESGVYAFKTNLSMAGRWLFSISAKVQGEPETVVGKIIFKATDAR